MRMLHQISPSIYLFYNRRNTQKVKYLKKIQNGNNNCLETTNNEQYK